MDIYDVINGHRSIRKYRPDPIPEALLNRILEAGIRASSSGNMQTYSMIVTTDPAIKQRLYEPHFEQKMVLQAPAVVTFCSDFHRMKRWLTVSQAPDNFDNFLSFMIGAIDAVLVSQNVALAAEAEGLGICYMGTTLASSKSIGAILKCPVNVVPVTGFVIGYPDENPAPRDRLPAPALIHRNTYYDPTDEEIRAQYRDRETAGWKRYMTFPELKEMVEKSGVKNLGQLYTVVKYSKESHVQYSKDLLDYLKSQECMNHE